MTSPSFEIAPFDHEDATLSAQAEALLDRAFGQARRTKTSYRFREGEQPAEGLSFMALVQPADAGQGPLGVLSFWHLRVGDAGTPALLLGPLAVEPHLQGRGIGRGLMRHGLAEAARRGHGLVFLVGDEPYYAMVGFSRVPDGRIQLPGPVDPARLLYLELTPGALSQAHGLVLSPSRHAARISAPRGATAG